VALCACVCDQLKEVTPGVYSFPMLRPEFCDIFTDEIDSYYASGLRCPRPNSMHEYGCIVNDIGA
jgi:hypothetical protein